MVFRKLRRELQKIPDGQHASYRALARVLFLTSVVVLLAQFNLHAAQAQTMEAHITVLSLSPARVRVEGKRAVATQSWSFRNAYAGLIGLGERIENLTLADANGVNVPVRKLASGEYQATSAATRWSYEVKLDAPAHVTDAAHVSWLAGEHGFLMLGDLLPLMIDEKNATDKSARVSFTLPANWSIISNEKKLADLQFEAADAEDAVFFTGADLRERRERVGSMEFTLATSGSWAFTDQDAMSMAASILKDFTKRVGHTTRTRTILMLSPFPGSVGAERWSAETRGGTVVLLSGKSPSKIAGLAQVSVPLTHELFHLWVPNGLPLDGNYDWFYEGFTSYQGLSASVRLRFLTFQDYLNALGRAYDGYLSASDRQKLSLLEASRQRWTSATSLIYQKGLLVAFLYDLTLRQASQGKRTLDDIYRNLFQLSSSGARRDGNEAVLAVLKSQSEMRDFVRRYIESANEIDLQAIIAPLGLEFARVGARSQISVSEKLNRQQRDLLSVFEYNEQVQRPRK